MDREKFLSDGLPLPSTIPITLASLAASLGGSLWEPAGSYPAALWRDPSIDSPTRTGKHRRISRR